MRIYRYTTEQIDYVREIAEGRYNDEIAELFNKRFKTTSMSASKMKSLKANHKIRSNVHRAKPGSQKQLFTEEQRQFIKDNAKGIGNQELTDLLNEEFELDVSMEQVRTWKHRHRISSGLTGQFEKGNVPIHKGTKGMFNVGGNKTSFKPGQVPHNYRPVGFERVDRDGYILVKVSDDGEWHERWRHKHKVIWEEKNGPIPEGHVLLFADGNPQNIKIENLMLISNNQLLRLNQNDLIYDDAELTKAGLIIADIITKASERKADSK